MRQNCGEQTMRSASRSMAAAVGLPWTRSTSGCDELIECFRGRGSRFSVRFSVLTEEPKSQKTVGGRGRTSAGRGWERHAATPDRGSRAGAGLRQEQACGKGGLGRGRCGRTPAGSRQGWPGPRQRQSRRRVGVGRGRAPPRRGQLGGLRPDAGAGPGRGRWRLGQGPTAWPAGAAARRAGDPRPARSRPWTWRPRAVALAARGAPGRGGCRVSRRG